MGTQRPAQKKERKKFICTTTYYCECLEINNMANAATVLDYYEFSNSRSGGYNTEYDELTLQNCITNATPNNDVISQVYMIEEMSETGDGNN